jgi:hypothetical protein
MGSLIMSKAPTVVSITKTSVPIACVGPSSDVEGVRQMKTLSLTRN